jgi:transketolase
MLGQTENIISHTSLAARLNAFGWDCMELDGHDVLAIQLGLLQMKSKRDGKPKALIAKTKKGHGIPDLEGMDLAHVMNPSAAWMDAVLGGSNE